jgi:hypothetical protein
MHGAHRAWVITTKRRGRRVSPVRKSTAVPAETTAIAHRRPSAHSTAAGATRPTGALRKSDRATKKDGKQGQGELESIRHLAKKKE